MDNDHVTDSGADNQSQDSVMLFSRSSGNDLFETTGVLPVNRFLVNEPDTFLNEYSLILRKLITTLLIRFTGNEGA